MKPFSSLTYRGQVRRLRSLAQTALQAYDLDVGQFRLIFHGENTTFRVDAQSRSGAPLALPAAYEPGRFLLRVHRPGYQNAASIASELAWLAALRAEGLTVPEPVRARDGAWIVEAGAPGVPAPRVCSLLRWMRGRLYGRHPRPAHFVALGRLMAHLHRHAAGWSLPEGFERRCWDWDGLFGDRAGFNLPAEEVWALLPEPHASRFRAVAARTRAAMQSLGRGRDVFGLIHADLHLGNVLFAGGEVRPIDFDDCGFAHWIYDFATTLCEYLDDEAYPAFRDALFAGYTEVRSLPALEHLSLLMAARQVSLAVWATDMAQINPRFAERLEGWYAWVAQGLDALDAGRRPTAQG